jgi:Flp pilus assembly protein TadD
LEEYCYDTEQLLVLGAKALTAFDIEKALNKFFARALRADPKNPKVLIAVGKARFLIGQMESAKSYFQKTLKLDPKNEDAYFYLGLIFKRKNRLKDAEEMFLKALEFQATNPNVYNNLGVTLLEQKRYKEAVSHFEKALEIYPEHINSHYNLGMALWGLGRVEDAVKQYTHVLQLKPEWATAANSLAWILATDKKERIRNGEEAVRWALVACKATSRKNPDYIDTLAAAYAEAGSFQKAVKTAEEGLALAKSIGDKELQAELKDRIKLYKSEKSFFE